MRLLLNFCYKVLITGTSNNTGPVWFLLLHHEMNEKIIEHYNI